MKAPRRRRPRIREISQPPPDVDLYKISKCVRYVGSPEHKDRPSFAGHPRPRADASICDPRLADSQDQLTKWLRDAMLHGNVGSPWEGRYPRYVWYKKDNVVYEGRLVNSGSGEYKGYPLDRSEWPPGFGAKG
ncbi:MAG: hypothetical protein ACE5JX_18010 [Acidobacteriota bacterium]